MKLEETEAYIKEAAKIKARSDALKRMLKVIVKMLMALIVILALLIGGYVGYISYQDTEKQQDIQAREKEQQRIEQKELADMLTQEDKTNILSGKKMMRDRDNATITLHPLNDHTLILEADWMGGLALFEDLYNDKTKDNEILASKGYSVISKIKLNTIELSGGSQYIYAIDADNIRYKRELKSVSVIQSSVKWRLASDQEREQWRVQYNQIATALGKPKM